MVPYLCGALFGKFCLKEELPRGCWAFERGAGKEENPIQTTFPKEEYKDKDKDDWIDKIKEIEQWREENPI